MLAQFVPDRTKALESAEAVRIAARAVIKAEAPDLTAELKAAMDRVHRLRAAAYWLWRQSCCPDSPERPLWRGEPRLDERDADNSPTAQLLRVAAAGFGADEAHPAWAEWEKAAAALAKDSTAALPVYDHGRPHV
jgi:hypothetical protein